MTVSYREDLKSGREIVRPGRPCETGCCDKAGRCHRRLSVGNTSGVDCRFMNMARPL